MPGDLVIERNLDGIRSGGGGSPPPPLPPPLPPFLAKEVVVRLKLARMLRAVAEPASEAFLRNGVVDFMMSLAI